MKYFLTQMEIFIKNMVCPRCIRVVNEELSANGFKVESVELGKAVIAGDEVDTKTLADVLEKNGFELLEEKSAKLVNEIKTFLIGYIRKGELSEPKLRISAVLEQKFRRDYSYLSHLFSQMESNTLEKFIINQKIEMIKEWLAYDELSLAEIAWQMGYSSTAHLSSQFRQVTGFSPSEFRNKKGHYRKSLDEI
ncbi:MAG TPA: AraC family transcriptional regulator [Bacteroidales bacterium]|nr:AraC family transcriptional regulator [Bacteroidales bacterium]